MKKMKVPYLLLLIPIVLSLIILFLPKFLPNKLPLFYSLPWGETQLASSNQFLIVPSIVLGLTLVNLFVAHSLHSQQVLLKETLYFSSILISVILVIAVLKVILIFI